MSIITSGWSRIGVVALALLSSCSSSGQSQSNSVTPTSSVAPKKPLTQEPLEQASIIGAEPGTAVTAAATDGRLIVLAVCNQASAAAGIDGALSIWFATDARRWEQASVPESDRCVNQIESTPFGFFARDADTGLWSQDGELWQTWSIDQTLNPDLGKTEGFDAIFPSPDQTRLTLLLLDHAPGESTVARLITTTDGSTWGAGPGATLFDNASIAGVLEGGKGILAFGASPGGEFVPTAAVFSSLDGLHWKRTTPPGPDFENKFIYDMVAFDGGFAAVGGDFFETGLMTAWTSPDGITWNRSPHPLETLDPSVAQVTARSVTNIDDVLWAAGVDYDASRSQEELPALWTSSDGITWIRVETSSQTDAIPFALVSTPERTVGVWPPSGMPNTGTFQLFVTSD